MKKTLHMHDNLSSVKCKNMNQDISVIRTWIKKCMENIYDILDQLWTSMLFVLNNKLADAKFRQQSRRLLKREKAMHKELKEPVTKRASYWEIPNT